MPQDTSGVLHHLDLSAPVPPILSGHLRMGGTNPSGLEISANNRFLTLGGQPWTPVMGEMHYSRCPRPSWRDELLKMKAGGIQIIASYIFWNFHEEIQGQFEWTGNRDLRAFVRLCAQLGLLAYPRIGPWAHGEARLGGFPDWLLEKCAGQVRQDSPPYLGYAQIFYRQIAAQLEGLLWKDGGPVVGLQLENELADNPTHILTLKRLAQEAGLVVPLYTMTGWGPAQVPQDEVIPVFGGYPDAPWDRPVDDWARPSRKHYFFSPIRDDNAIGADLARRPDAPDLDYLQRYPYGTCELGGGVQVTYHRRPSIQPEDVTAIPFCKLGSGANFLGYYMYHGGTNPIGQLSTFQESQDSGYPNDLPIRSYDFQAPLGEAGQLRPHYHSLRLLHLFLQDFGPRLAPLLPAFPSDAPTSLEDRSSLRWVARSDGRQAFLFVNNYQRIEALPDHPALQFELQLKEETLRFPSTPFHLCAGSRLLWPVNFDLGGLPLKYATANLLCRLEVEGIPTFVFASVAGIPPEFAFDEIELVSFTAPGTTHQHDGTTVRLILSPDGSETLLEVHGRDRTVARILLLPPNLAARLWKANLWGQDRLFFSRAALIFDQAALRLRATQPEDLTVGIYPAPASLVCEACEMLKPTQIGLFKYYQPLPSIPTQGLTTLLLRSHRQAAPIESGSAGVAQSPPDSSYYRAGRWKVALDSPTPPSVSQVYLRIDYTGDCARAYLGPQLVADDFWFGRTWEIGLKDLDPSVWVKGLELEILPLRQDAPVYIPPENLPAFDPSGQALHLNSITAVPELEATLRLAL